MPNEAYHLARRRIVNNAKRRGQSSLDLRSKGLTELPGEIGELTSLKRLDLSDNALTTLPDEIGLLTSLEELVVNFNSITQFPESLWRLPRLAKLLVNNNQLREFPASIAQLSSLHYLEADRNRIGQLTAEIGKLRWMTVLSLESNQLNSLPIELERLTNLAYLNIGHNKLEEVPPSVFRLPSLAHLYLRGNKLTELPSRIGDLVHLRTLALEGNRLSSLPSEIGNLKQLTRLELSGNRLAELPSSLGLVTTLAKAAEADTPPVIDGLQLEANPLRPPYPDLIRAGQPSATSNVLAWLRGELDPAILGDPAEDSSDDISEIELEGALEQRPASFRFGIRDGKIDALPEDAVATDMDAAADLHLELLAKARLLEARLNESNSDSRARSSVSRLVAELEKDLSQARPGVLLSRSRSIEADRNAFDSEEGRRELFPDAIAMMDDVLLSLQDLLAVFPIVREIEAERLALAIQGDAGTLDTINLNTRSIKETALNSEIVAQGASEALKENDEQIRDARTIVVQARLIADQLLTIRNFAGGAALFARRTLGSSAKRIASELGDLGNKSWEEIKANLPEGIGTASKALPLVALIGLLAAISPPVAGIAGAAAAFRPLSRALRKIVGSVGAESPEKVQSSRKRTSSEQKRRSE